MANFAKGQLLKYGWTEGKGLGKEENGITEAIKPKLKFDTAGVGHKSDVCNNWWESVFNKAAKNVSIDKSSSGVSVHVVDQDAVIFSTKQDLKSLQKEHRSGYKAFLKTSTLENGKVIHEKTECPKLEVDLCFSNSTIDDDKLFEACGGRTAHKGARHGLNLSGKLARIARQEEEMLSALSLQKGSRSIQSKEITAKKEEKSKKKEKRKRKALSAESEEDIVDEDNKDISHLLNRLKPVAPSKKSKKAVNHLAQMLDKSCKLDENQIEIHLNKNEFQKSKNKKRKTSRDEFVYIKCADKNKMLNKESTKKEEYEKLDSKEESNCDIAAHKDEDDFLGVFKDITFKRYEAQNPSKFNTQKKRKSKSKAAEEKKVDKLTHQLNSVCSLSEQKPKKKKKKKDKKSCSRFDELEEDTISRIDVDQLNSRICKKKKKRLMKKQSLEMVVKKLRSKHIVLSDSKCKQNSTSNVIIRSSQFT